MAVVMMAFSSVAQSPDVPEERPTIIDHIEESGKIAIEMPDALLNRVQYVAEKEDVKPLTGKMGGYRIQVFSDNNARTAKSEARTRARNISAQFPQYPTYVVYSSPYWRLRVGNFRTQDEDVYKRQDIIFPGKFHKVGEFVTLLHNSIAAA